MGTKHSEAVGAVNHAITAATYADIAARDADTAFHIAVNIDKTVRVDSPLGYFVLTGIGPAAWTEFGSDHPNESLAEVLATGNTSGGTDLVISAGDVATITDAPVAGTDAANKDYVDSQVSASDTLAEVLAIGNVTGGTSIEVSENDAIVWGDGSQQDIAATPTMAEGRISTALQAGTFDILGYTDLVNGLYVRDDGLKAIYPAVDIIAIAEADLTTPWDVTTGSDGNFVNVNGQMSVPTGVGFSPDGVKMFVTDPTTIFQYTLSTPWLLTSATYDSVSFSLSTQDTSCFGVTFSPDGLSFYIAGSATDIVYRYNVTTPWTLTGAAYSGSSFDPPEITALQAVYFRRDGHLMYLTNTSGVIYEYQLTGAWDITTALHNGKTLTTSITGVRWPVVSPYGDRMILGAQSTDLIYTYEIGLIAGGDSEFQEITVDTLTAANANVGSIILDHEDVNSITFLDDKSIQVTAAVPGARPLEASTLEFKLRTDVSAQIGETRGLWMSADGLKTYIGDNTTQAAYEYDQNFPFDTSTLSYTGNSLVTGQNFTEFFLKPDGTIAYFMTFGGDFRFYTLSTPFDLSTAGGISTFNTALTNTSSFSAIDNGFNAYFTNSSTNTVLEWEMTTTWDITTLVDTGRSFAPAEITNSLQDMFISQDGREYFLVETVTSVVYQYRMTTPTDISTSVFVGQVTVNDIYGEFCVSFDHRKAFGATPFSDDLDEYTMGLATEGKSVFKSTETERIITDAIVFVDDSVQALAAVPTLTDGRLAGIKFNQIHDISGDDAEPRCIAFRPNGLSMYVVGALNDIIMQFDLTVPWDLTTGTQVASVGYGTGNANGLVLKPDGTKALIVRNNDIREFNLSTPWDLSTAVGGTVFSFATEDTVGTTLNFNPDGLSFYVFGIITDTLYKYDCLTAWDISTASYSGISLLLTDQIADPFGTCFRDDGVIMFMVGDLTNVIYEYRLSTPWDITSAYFTGESFVAGIPDTRCPCTANYNSKLYFPTSSGGGSIYEFDLGIVALGNSTFEDVTSEAVNTDRISFPDDTWQLGAANPTMLEGRISGTLFNQAFDTTTQTTQPIAVWFRRDGLKMYATGFSTVTVEEYTLTTAWDTSTATHNNTLSVFAQTSSPTGVHLSPDGLTMLIVSGAGAIADAVLQYTLATAWDLSTATYDSLSFSVAAQDTGPAGIWFKPGGLEFYLTGLVNGAIFKYTTNVPWTIQGAAYASVSFNPTEFTTVEGSIIREDGTLLYIVNGDGATDVIYEYRLNQPWDITTAIHTGFTLDTEIAPALSPVIAPYLDKFYVADQNGAAINEYDMGIGSVPVGEILNVPNIGGQVPSRIASDDIEIFQLSDLEDLASGGIITVNGVLSITLRTDITTSVRFVVNPFSRLTFPRGSGAYTLTYSGTGTFITSTDANIIIQTQLTASSTGTLFAVTGTFFNIVAMDQMSLTSWSLGSMSRSSDAPAGPLLFITSIAMGDWQDSLTLDECSNIVVLDMDVFPFAGASVPLFDLKSQTVAGTYTFNLIGGTLAASEKLIRVDPGIHDDSRTLIVNSGVSGTMFDTTGGSTGTFTVVADAAVAATAITSVTDSAGVARFNFTVGPTMYVNQEVVISTFVTNTAYNGTFIITAVGVGFFEVSSIAFGSDETGSFLSNSVTLTDTGTSLVDGDTLTIETDLSTDYDGAATVYNQLTNSFQINRTFTATQTGTWDTSGISENDVRILAATNPGHRPSETFGFGMAHNNATATTTLDGTYGAIDVGTMTTLDEDRVKLIDATACIWEITSHEPLELSMNTTAWVSKSGATVVDYRMALAVDGVVPTFATEPYERMQATNAAQQVTVELFKSGLVKGQTVQPMFAGDGNTNALTFEDFTVKWRL